MHVFRWCSCYYQQILDIGKSWHVLYCYFNTSHSRPSSYHFAVLEPRQCQHFRLQRPDKPQWLLRLDNKRLQLFTNAISINRCHPCRRFKSVDYRCNSKQPALSIHDNCNIPWKFVRAYYPSHTKLVFRIFSNSELPHQAAVLSEANKHSD